MSVEVRVCSRAIERWFAGAARDLPWRANRTPWRSLVSEFMLQQTQVSRVLERFEPFMERFPHPASLAAASEQEVLLMWQGLGYYRRARHLHRAAQAIVADCDGEVPLDIDSLLRLPGVGRYTAGSIASIVGGRREAIVDGNVARFLARLYCDDAPQDDLDFVKRTWLRAKALVDACECPALLNEGMMELGAMVCMPATASCELCPVAALCVARERGRVAEIPPPKRRPDRVVVHHHAVVIRRRGRVLLERRPQCGLWAGLWQAPALETVEELTAGQVAEQLPYPVEGLVRLRTVTRQLTHRTVLIHVHAASLVRAARVPQIDGRKWVRTEDLAGVPLSSAAVAVLKVSDAAPI
jgi:A/G-specific adenine glycosylase